MLRSPNERGLLGIDGTAVAYIKHKDHQALVLDLIHDSAVANSDAQGASSTDQLLQAKRPRVHGQGVDFLSDSALEIRGQFPERLVCLPG